VSDTPQDCVGNWQRWGPDDERGALNLITPEVVRGGAAEVRTGRVYQLGLPIQRSGVPNFEYRGAPQRLTLMNHQDEAMFAAYGGDPGVGANEDMLVMASHAVTHIDALSHVYCGGSHFNGHSHEGMSPYNGAARCGIEKAGGFATRGVLLDVAGHREVDWLEAGYRITAKDLEACVAAQGTELRAGDAVFVRTGWLEWFFADGAREALVPQPGIGLDAAEWLAERDIAVIASDNSSVEATPFSEGFLAVHQELLVRRGIYLMEHVRLSELAADACHAFLLSVGTLLVTGATGSPVNPIAVG
jgi:kynurenine formamidase